ncbi:MAG TPA: hypothetical protein VFX37_11925, partial [Pseudolabrys sp.]|nr:hypothetical protein [Pseudolabrys sp.]
AKAPSRQRSVPEKKMNLAPSLPSKGAADTQLRQTKKAAAADTAAITRLHLNIEAPSPVQHARLDPGDTATKACSGARVEADLRIWR